MIALFFDTETNGIRTWDNPNFQLRVVQLGAILQDTDSGRVLGELNLIADVGDYQIPAGASNVHGITNELSRKAGVPLSLIDEAFYELLLRADCIVAHNIQYDIDVVTDDLQASATLISKRPRFCTMDGSLYLVQAPLSARQVAYFSSKGMRPDAPYKVPNLTEAHQYFFGRPFVGAHDAMADIRACRDIYMELIRRGHYICTPGFQHQPSQQLASIIASQAEKL